MAHRHEMDEGVITKREASTRLRKPRMYKVLLHNDDFTTKEFVVDILKTVFHRSESEAVAIMLHVHNSGIGIAGVFPREIAETKIRTVEHMAHQREYPLRLSMEPEE